jgi:hypothetical protein
LRPASSKNHVRGARGGAELRGAGFATIRVDPTRPGPVRSADHDAARRAAGRRRPRHVQARGGAGSSLPWTGLGLAVGASRMTSSDSTPWSGSGWRGAGGSAPTSPCPVLHGRCRWDGPSRTSKESGPSDLPQCGRDGAGHVTTSKSPGATWANRSRPGDYRDQRRLRARTPSPGPSDPPQPHDAQRRGTRSVQGLGGVGRRLSLEPAPRPQRLCALCVVVVFLSPPGRWDRPRRSDLPWSLDPAAQHATYQVLERAETESQPRLHVRHKLFLSYLFYALASPSTDPAIARSLR